MHPVLQDLQRAAAIASPKNMVLFVYQWAAQRLKVRTESFSDDEQQEVQSLPSRSHHIHVDRRRNAFRLVEPTILELETSLLSMGGQKQPHNEESKSCSMIALRNCKFCSDLSFDELQKLVDASELRSIGLYQELSRPQHVLMHFSVVVQGSFSYEQQGVATKHFYPGEVIFEAGLVDTLILRGTLRSNTSNSLICIIANSKIRRALRESREALDNRLQKMLQSVRQFEYVDSVELAKLCRLVSMRRLSDGEVLIKQETPFKALVLVLSGRIEKQRVTFQREIVPSKIFEEGTLLGFGTLTREGDDYRYVAQGQALIGLVTKSDIESAVDSLNAILIRRR